MPYNIIESNISYIIFFTMAFEKINVAYIIINNYNAVY